MSLLYRSNSGHWDVIPHGNQEDNTEVVLELLEIHPILNYQHNILLLKTQEFAQYLRLSSAFW